MPGRPFNQSGRAPIYSAQAFRFSDGREWQSIQLPFSLAYGASSRAWHYAIDGYLSIVLTWLLWRAAGRWVARDKALVPR